jgi:hypothetical protein
MDGRKGGSAADYQLFISEGADRSGKKHICASAARSAADGSRILSHFRLLNSLIGPD